MHTHNILQRLLQNSGTEGHLHPVQLPLSSFKAVEEAISRIEDESSATFWQRDCHTIKAARVSQPMYEGGTSLC